MSGGFESVQEAVGVLADPEDPRWGEAFAYLSAHPDTAQLMLETFRDTLAEMGAEAGGVDPLTGEPLYAPGDVASALGIPEVDLDPAVAEPAPGTAGPGRETGG
jgi:hypothetical protein